MDQRTAAMGWMHLSGNDEAERVYLRTVIDAMMAVARKYGARIDWENSDVFSRVIAFTVEPGDIGAFSADLADLLGGEIE